MDALRIGVIGLGNFARQQHLPNLARIPEVSLCSLCDIDPDRAKSLAQKYGVESWAVDYAAVLEDPRIDAVVVAVRDDLQAVVAAEAIRAGKHVYVEKPLSADPQVCRALAQEARSADRVLAVGFNKRFAPIYRRAKELLDLDGGMRNVQLRMADDAWRWARGYAPGFMMTLDTCHLFDLLRWFTHSDIESVYCVSSRPDDDAVAVKMKSGCVASIMSSGHGTMDMPKERLDALSLRGGVCAEDYVELRTFGFPDVPSSISFPGHSHPDGEYLHVPLMEKLGFPAWLALRRSVWEMRRSAEADARERGPYHEEKQRFIDRTIPNFLRDQGWLGSVRAFAKGILAGERTDHATADDAAAAAEAASAAELSRASGHVVRL